MKKYIALLLALAFLFTLAANPGKQTTESTESTETQPQELQDPPSASISPRKRSWPCWTAAT